MSINIYGESESGISKIQNLEDFQKINFLKESMLNEAISKDKWLGFKKKEFKECGYCLIHETGIGAIVFKNFGEEKVRFSFNINGGNIKKCNFSLFN